MAEAEFRVEAENDMVVITAADDEDAIVYILEPVDAALLAAAIFDAVEETK